MRVGTSSLGGDILLEKLLANSATTSGRSYNDAIRIPRAVRASPPEDAEVVEEKYTDAGIGSGRPLGRQARGGE
jgi:hypothetical protein